MFNIILRVLIIYIIVIFVMRLMGKRQIGEMEPFELVITLIIADLATIPMAEQSIPIWYGVIPLLVICVIHFMVSVLIKKCPCMRNLLNGKPVIVIDDNGIVFKELKKLNISSEELLEALRNLDYFDLSEINYAIIERNGKISVIPKAANMPVTREDMHIKTAQNQPYHVLIENGKPVKSNFAEAGLEYETTMDKILKSLGCGTKAIAFLAATADGDAYFQQFGKVSKTLAINFTDRNKTTEERDADARNEKGRL